MTRAPVCPGRLLRLGTLLLAVGGALAPSAQVLLRVEASVGGVVARVNGLSIGAVPTEVLLEPGRYVIEGTRPQFEPARVTVDGAHGDTLAVRLEMVRLRGEVVVDGVPDGAEVLVDGEPIGGSAASAPVGAVTVRVRVPGAHDAEARGVVVAGGTTVLTYTQAGRDAGATRIGLAIPGIVQIRDGRTVPGLLYAGGVVGALVLTAAVDQRVRRIDTDLDRAVAIYAVATGEGAIAAARRQALALYDEAEGARSARTAAFLVALGVHLVSAADAYVIHSRRPTLEVGRRTAGWRVSPEGAGLVARLTL
ncbi:hypothetical protein [Rubrivirga sp. IMCC45206]|uniref:hypothetical protein n=1 Tax=Rubrivirga sp. IMCC45206 TaxID=3391614 RepID=UPI00398F8FE9